MKRRILLFAFLMLGAFLSYGQNSLGAKQVNPPILFGSFNSVNDYSGDLNDIGSILNSTAPTDITNAQNELMTQYTAMSTVPITTTELDAMLDSNQANYDTWMSVWDTLKADPSYTPQDLYVLRSVIMNIKSKM